MIYKKVFETDKKHLGDILFFIDTDRKEQVKENDWFLEGEEVLYCDENCIGEYPILRPIRPPDINLLMKNKIPLQESIEHYKRVIKEQESFSGNHCELCNVFFEKTDCKECIICWYTKQAACVGTPWKELYFHTNSCGNNINNDNPCITCRELQIKELRFLQNLLKESKEIIDHYKQNKTLKVGDYVQVKQKSDNVGRYWDIDGEMDKYQGQIGKIKSIYGDNVTIENFKCDKWYWCFELHELEKVYKDANGNFYKETGEYRPIKEGDYYLGDFEYICVLYCTEDYDGKRKILTPINIRVGEITLSKEQFFEFTDEYRTPSTDEYWWEFDKVVTDRKTEYVKPHQIMKPLKTEMIVDFGICFRRENKEDVICDGEPCKIGQLVYLKDGDWHFADGSSCDLITKPIPKAKEYLEEIKQIKLQEYTIKQLKKELYTWKNCPYMEEK